jgi:hypothetical protein
LTEESALVKSNVCPHQFGINALSGLLQPHCDANGIPPLPWTCLG